MEPALPLLDRPSPSGATLPPGVRVYAVGDIHGRADLLKKLLLAIGADINDRPIASPLLIFLGDYIDRGPASAEVIELLLRAGRFVTTICLAGNHELYLLRFLHDTGFGPRWLGIGGRETLASYGITPPLQASRRTLSQTSQALRDALPPDHLRFFAGLGTSVTLGDYIFVHAGLKPGRPVAEHDVNILTTIREPFLTHPHGFGLVVVHGHTPVPAPEVGPDRINLDTAAYATGVLTCIALEGSTFRFLRADADSAPAAD
jgi:serine/threonine protein phosphatase 1